MRDHRRVARAVAVRVGDWMRTLVALTAMAVILSGCTATHHHNAVSTTQTAPTTASARSTPPPARVTPETLLGASGMRASWVEQENARPGTSAWRMPAQASSAIDGFADKAYAADGQTVRLYVSTRAAVFHVEAYRMGYYGGAGARQVWRSPANRGGLQRACPRTPRISSRTTCSRGRRGTRTAATTSMPGSEPARPASIRCAHGPGSCLSTAP